MVYNGKPYEQMDDLGIPLFLETPILYEHLDKTETFTSIKPWFVNRFPGFPRNGPNIEASMPHWHQNPTFGVGTAASWMGVYFPKETAH